MDAFFASVEQRDNPALRGLPVIVGGVPEKRGVVATCSYEARVFGIHSGMASAAAKRLCPQGIFISGNFQKYKAASSEVFAVFRRFTTKVEPMSIDEAYLDVTENLLHECSATKLARMIQREIYEKTHLTASAGVSCNKFLAKVASGLKKPCGLSVILPEEAERFLEELPIEKFHGIGRVTAKKLHDMNIRFGRDLKALPESILTAHFGKVGSFYYHIVRGEDNREVETDYEAKSCGRERTFAQDAADIAWMRNELVKLSTMVAPQLARHAPLGGRTVTLKIRYRDFRTATRSVSLPSAVRSAHEIAAAALPLLEKTEAKTTPVRLLGISVSNFLLQEEPPRFYQPEFPAFLSPKKEKPEEMRKTASSRSEKAR